MSLYRCVYVSSARLEPLHKDAQVAKIADHAITANAAMQVTGALMYDGTRFAQLIEGPPLATISLAGRIAIDKRHCEVVFLEEQNTRRRLFSGFSMAYSGRSVFVERTIARPLLENDRRSKHALRSLIQLMQEFSR